MNRLTVARRWLSVVKDVMARDVVVVHPGDSIRTAVRAMHDHKISGLPVVETGRCVGVITVQDLLDVLSAALDRHLNEVNEEIQNQAVGAKSAGTGRT